MTINNNSSSWYHSIILATRSLASDNPMYRFVLALLGYEVNGHIDYDIIPWYGVLNKTHTYMHTVHAYINTTMIPSQGTTVYTWHSGTYTHVVFSPPPPPPIVG